MRTTAALLVVMCIGTAAHAQCDTLTIGTPDRASVDVGETPFPTAPGRGSKVQYLYQAAELSALLCPFSQVTAIALEVIDDDINAPLACEVTVQVRIGNSTAITMAQFDPAISSLSASSSYFVDTIEAGLLVLPFSAPFLWNGTSNVVVDISYTRSAVAGLSPRVIIDDSLGFVASRYMHIQTPVNGWNLSDVPLPGWTTSNISGSGNTRPVVHFLTDPQMLMGMEVLHGTGATIHPNPTSGFFTVRTADIPLEGSVQLLDAAGRVALAEPLVAGSSVSVDINVRGLVPGLYVVRSVASNGAAEVIGRLAVE